MLSVDIDLTQIDQEFVKVLETALIDDGEPALAARCDRLHEFTWHDWAKAFWALTRDERDEYAEAIRECMTPDPEYYENGLGTGQPWDPATDPSYQGGAYNDSPAPAAAAE